MGQIVTKNAKPKRANLNAIWTGSLANYIPDNGEYILVSSDNSMNQHGDGKFDAYIVGDGTAKASELPIHSDTADFLELKKVSKGTNWTTNIVTNMKAGVTYYLRWSASATIYLKVYDSQGTSTTVISNKSVTGPYVFEYTPSYDIPRVDVYSSVATIFSILVMNEQKSIVTQSDVVNNTMDGGAKKVLSAEQGRILNEANSFLVKKSIPVSFGSYTSKGFSGDTLNMAKVVFPTHGVKVIKIKPGYEYILYAGDTPVYNNTDLTTIIGSYTSNPYFNNTELLYFWVNIRKTDNSEIRDDELFDILYVDCEDSDVNFKTITDNAEYYKYGNRVSFEPSWIAGEGINIHGAVKTGSNLSRTDYFDVRNIDAIILRGSTPYNTTQFASKTYCRWVDSEMNPIAASSHLLISRENEQVIGVPENAAYVSISIGTGISRKFDVILHKSVTESIYSNKAISPIGHLKKVTLILVCGQSLGNGSGAKGKSTELTYFPVMTTKTTGEVSCFSFITLNQFSTERPDRGLGEMFVESIAKENNFSVYSNEWKDHYIVIENCAVGGKTITALSDPNGLYARVTDAITLVKQLCDEFGFTLDIPVWCWMQGEQDMKGDTEHDDNPLQNPADYKQALLSLQNQICSSITTITGISKRPKCVLYQPSSQCLYTQNYGFSNPYLAFTNAYVELLRDNEEFIASTPVYIFDGSDRSENNEGFVHLNARSYKLLGAYNGYSIKRYLIDGVALKGVIPTDITVSNNTITIKYNVPCPPLVVDTDWVKQVANYGFNVVDSNDNELISSVSVFDDVVTIECTANPVGAKLRYGLNGDYHHYPGSNYTGADGRQWGGRGNIRDSQGDHVWKEIKEYNQILKMYNWAYCFEKELT